jgi:acyl carrier protein
MIDRNGVLRVIREFVQEHSPDTSLDHLEEMSASQVIKQSLELVEFILALEENLGIEINISEIGERLISRSFGSLADDLVVLSQKSQG